MISCASMAPADERCAEPLISGMDGNTPTHMQCQHGNFSLALTRERIQYCQKMEKTKKERKKKWEVRAKGLTPFLCYHSWELWSFEGRDFAGIIATSFLLLDEVFALISEWELLAARRRWSYLYFPTCMLRWLQTDIMTLIVWCLCVYLGIL